MPTYRLLATPQTAPAAFDVFQLDGKILSPPCKIVECNGRTYDYQEQQAPGLVGAFGIYRGEKLVSVTYQIDIWAWAAQGSTLGALLQYLQGMGNARPPRGAALIDLRLAGMKMGQVALTKIPYQNNVEQGKWRYTIGFIQNRRLQLGGGPVQAPRNATEQASLNQSLENIAKSRQLGDITAAQAAQQTEALLHPKLGTH